MVPPCQSTPFLCHKAVLAAAGNSFFSQTLLSTSNITSGYNDGIDGDAIDHLHLPDYTATQVKELVLLCYGLVFNISEENSKYICGDESGSNANPLFKLLIVKTKRKVPKFEWKKEETFSEEDFYQYHISQEDNFLDEDQYHIPQVDHISQEDHISQDDNIDMADKKRMKRGHKKVKKKIKSKLKCSYNSIQLTGCRSGW